MSLKELAYQASWHESKRSDVGLFVVVGNIADGRAAKLAAHQAPPKASDRLTRCSSW